MDSQKSYFVGQLRRLVAPTPSFGAFPSSEETASHPDWLRAFTIFPNTVETDRESLMVRSQPQPIKSNCASRQRQRRLQRDRSCKFCGRPASAKMATARQARLPLQLGHASPHL